MQALWDALTLLKASSLSKESVQKEMETLQEAMKEKVCETS